MPPMTRIIAKVKDIEGVLNGIWKCPYCGDIVPLIDDIIGVEMCSCRFITSKLHPERRTKIFIRKSQIYKQQEGGQNEESGINAGSQRVS